MIILKVLRTLKISWLFVILIAVGCVQIPEQTTVNTFTETPTTVSPTKSTVTPSGPYGELRIAMTTFSNERFDPIAAIEATVNPILSPVFDMMFWLEGAELKPGIIEKWEVAADGTSWTYYIHKGIKFHNGEDLTADDVKFSLDRYKNEPTAYAAKDMQDAVRNIEIIDNYTVQINTIGKKPFLPYIMSLSAPCAGIVTPKDYFEQVGLEYFMRHPVGAGPFRFVRHVPGDIIEYEALHEHWRSVPAFKKFTNILVPEESTRIAMLKTGAIDGLEIGIENARELETLGYKVYVTDEIPIIVQLHGTYDSRAAGMPTTDIRVRQALSLAINRDEIGKSFFSGKLGPPMPPCLSTVDKMDIDFEYWKSHAANIYRYDPQLANQLLEEAGYPNGFNIKFYNWAASGAPYLPKLGEVIQSDWAKIGIKAEIVQIEQGVYTSWRAEPALPLVGQITLSRVIPYPITVKNLMSPYYSTGANRLLSAAFPDIDKLLLGAMSEVDSQKRRQMLAESVDKATSTYVVTPIGLAPVIVAIGNNVNVDLPYPTKHISGQAFRFIHR